jgi:hypothetical protein
MKVRSNSLNRNNAFSVRSASRRRKAAAALTAAAAFAGFGARLQAAPQYWDSSTSGTWATTGANSWSPNLSGGSDISFTAGNAAVFSTSGGANSPATNANLTITTTTLAADGITFNDQVTYTFTNAGTLTLSDLNGTAAAPANVIALGTTTGNVTFNGDIALPQQAAAAPTQYFSITNANQNSTLNLAGPINLNMRSAASTNSNYVVDLNGTAGSATGTGTAPVSNAGAITFGGTLYANSFTISSQTNAGGTVTFNAEAGIVSFNGNDQVYGLINLTGGTVNVGSISNGTAAGVEGLGLNFTGGTFSVGNAGTVIFNGLAGNQGIVLGNGAGGISTNASTNLVLQTGGVGNTSEALNNPTYSGNITGTGSVFVLGVANGGNTSSGTAVYSGNLSFTGGLSILPNTGTLALNNRNGTAGTLELTASDSYTGATTVGQTMTLWVGGTNGQIPGTQSGGSLTVAAGGTLLVDDSSTTASTYIPSRVGSGTIYLNGGGFSYKAVGGTTGSATPSVGTLALSGGQNYITTTGATSPVTSTLSLGGLALGAHSTLYTNLSGETNTQGAVVITNASSNAPAPITNGAANTGILPWAFDANGEFTTINSVNRIGAVGTVGSTAVVSTSLTGAAGENAKITAATAVGSAPITENSLVINGVITQALNNQTLTLYSGGLAFLATGTLGTAGSSDIVTASATNPELFVYSSSTGTINATISSTTTALTKYGAGTLVLAGPQQYTGPTTVDLGTLVLNNTTATSAISLVNTSNLTSSLYLGGSASLGTLPVTTGAPETVNGVNQSNSVIAFQNTNATAPTVSVNTAGGAMGVGSITNAAASAGNPTFAVTSTTTAGGSFTVNAITSSQTTGSLNFNTSNTVTANIGSLSGVSGSTIAFGGDGSGTSIVTAVLGQAGQTVEVNAGTLTTNTGRNTVANLQVDGGTLYTGSADRLSLTSGTSGQTLKINGGTLLLGTSASAYGLRVNGDNGPAGTGVANVTQTVSQSAGTLTAVGAEPLNLGSTSTAFTVAYNQTGGTVALPTSAGTLGADTGGTSTSTYNLSGGTFIIGTLQGSQPSAKQDFVWSGGTLSVGTLNAASLAFTTGGASSATANNVTGTGTAALAPGYTFNGNNYFSRSSITGGLTLATNNGTTGGTLAINIGGSTSAATFGAATTGDYDNVVASGSVNLNGSFLKLSLVNGFVPGAQTFTVLTSSLSTTGINGQFENEVGSNSTGTILAANGAQFTYNEVAGTGTEGFVLSNYTAPVLTWTGQTNANFDTVAGDINWQNANSTAVPFVNGDSATFGPTVVTNNDVKLTGVGSVQIAALSFTNTSGTYILDGVGSFTAASLAVTGNGGTAVINATGAVSGATTIGAGATLQIGSGTTSGAIGNTPITTAGTLTFDRTTAFVQGTDFASLAGAGTVNLTASTVTTNAANTFSGQVNVDANSTLSLGAGGAAGGLGSASTIADSGAVVFNRSNGVTQGTDFGAITGAGSISITAGAATFNSGTGFTGNFYPGAHTVTLAGTGAVSVGTFNAAATPLTYTNTYSSGNTVTLANGANTITTLTNSAATGGGLTVSVPSAGSLTVTTVTPTAGSTTYFGGTGVGTINSNVFATGGTTIGFSGGTWTLPGSVNQQAANIVIAGGNVTVTNTGNNNFNQVNSLNVSSGTFNDNATYGLRMGSVFGAGNAEAGETSVGTVSGGYLQVTNNGLQLGDNANSGVSNATFTVSGGTLSVPTSSITLGNTTTGTGKTQFFLSGGNVVGNSTIAGSQGAGAIQDFVWTGGTVTVATYNATNLAGTAGAQVGSVTTGAGATGFLTNGGGTLAVGGTNSSGALVSGKTTITGGYIGNGGASDTMVFNLGGTTASGAFQDAGLGKFSLLAVSGTVAVDGQLLVNVLSGFTPTTSQSFQIITSAGTGGVTGTFSNLTLATGNTYTGTTANGGYSYEAIYSQNGNNVTLTDFSSLSAPTPEPSSLGLLGLGGLAMMRRRRKSIATPAVKA